ncbi:hypothetical protein [Streptomyces sp. NPDC058953]|uniref:hypothetical protein n=1 Tax=unclassified Streptomyces TaxID=2593676 RepID=UPI00367CE5C4
MITIKTDNTSFVRINPMTDRPAVASACSLGFSASLIANGSGLGNGTGLSGGLAAFPATSLRAELSAQGVERVERPTGALAAAAAKARVMGYALTAAGAVNSTQQTKQHPTTKWAFRGPEPWSDPA